MVLGVYGAGGNGKILVDLAETVNMFKQRWQEIVFIDDVIGVSESYRKRVYTFEEAITAYDSDEIEFAVSVGDPADRELLYRRIKDNGYYLATIIHPHSNISPSLIAGEGLIVANGFIGSDVTLGDNVAVGYMALIGHDTCVKSNTMISAGVFIAGHCSVEEKVYIGPAAAIRDRLRIGTASVIGMNAAVYKDVPAHTTAIGNPAKCIVREHGKKLF